MIANQEPVRFRIAKIDGRVVGYVFNREGKLICTGWLPAIGRRVAACINACAGIPTEKLETGEARAVRDELADIATLTEQRHELLAALQSIVSLRPIGTQASEYALQAEGIAMKAIAMAKGGAA